MTTLLNPIGIGTVPFDHTGDEARPGFTKIINAHAAFIAAIGKRRTAPGTFGNTTSGGGTSTIFDTSQSWVTDQFRDQTLTIQSGTGPTVIPPGTTPQATSNNGYSKPIVSNTASSITVATPFPFSIDNGCLYEVTPAVLDIGSDGFATALGSTDPNTLIDTKQAWTADQWQGFAATLFGGAYAGLSFPIASNTNNALTLLGNPGAAILAGTPYAIGPITLAMNDFSHSIRPPQLASLQNDYDAGGLLIPGVDCLYLEAAAGGSAISGIDTSGMIDKWRLLLIASSLTDVLSFLDHSNLSQPANQFSTAAAAGMDLNWSGSCFIMNVVGTGLIFL